MRNVGDAQVFGCNFIASQGILSKLSPFYDALQPIQKSFEESPYPVQLVKQLEKGRHLVTPR
jgi:hypothetical protein